MSFGKERGRRKPPIGPQERIGYYGDIKRLLRTVASQYDFGTYLNHEVKQNGYEDFNLILRTQGKPATHTFFIKCFADWRSKGQCKRYLTMIQKALADGIETPPLFQNADGDVLTTVDMEGIPVRLAAMHYLDGGNILESNRPLTVSEKTAIIGQAAQINRCNFVPTKVEDSWAIINMKQKFEENRESVDPEDAAIIDDLLEELKASRWQRLPKAFVHGDIRSTNVMRHNDGHVYVIDFSVANWYPRIMEFAILCCDLLFDPENPETFNEAYHWALNEYQKAGIMLTSNELATLPLFVRLAHAANVLGASCQDELTYISQKENDHWLTIGKKGLRFTVENWKP